MIIDQENKISELNENNNTFNKTITVSSENVTKPDLIITDVGYVTSEKNIEGRDYVQVDFIVKYRNNGTVPMNGIASPFHFIIKSDPTNNYPKGYSGGAIKEDGEYIAINQEYQKTIGSYLLNKGDNLNAKFYFTIDSDNVISESNENNNTFEKNITFNSGSDKVNIIYPNGGEIFKIGSEKGITIKWQGGKDLVQIGVVGKNAGMTSNGFNSDNTLGWIKTDVKPNSSLTWDGTMICALDGTNCSKIEGSYKILAVSKSANGNLIYGSDGPNGDIANYDLSDNYFTVSNQKDSIRDNYSSNAKLLVENKFKQLLAEIKLLRDEVREQKNEIKYLNSLLRGVAPVNDSAQDAINNFITYGVDNTTKKLGEGERAAVVADYKNTFKKLPDDEKELADMIKIAEGVAPLEKNIKAEQVAKEQFLKIYKRVPDMNDAFDSKAVKIMAYGLRTSQRNAKTEAGAIATFKSIHKHNPKVSADWTEVRAVAYSGATKKKDSDKDGLADETEKKLGTNPNKADTDGDGFNDGIEVLKGFNPLKK